MGDDGPVKIGITNKLRSRMSQLQNGNPEVLRLIGLIPRGTREMEAHLHAMFDCFRIRGEWFSPAPEVIEYAERHGPPRNVKRTMRRPPTDLDLAAALFAESKGVRVSEVLNLYGFEGVREGLRMLERQQTAQK